MSRQLTFESDSDANDFRLRGLSKQVRSTRSAAFRFPSRFLTARSTHPVRECGLLEHPCGWTSVSGSITWQSSHPHSRTFASKRGDVVSRATHTLPASDAMCLLSHCHVMTRRRTSHSNAPTVSGIHNITETRSSTSMEPSHRSNTKEYKQSTCVPCSLLPHTRREPFWLVHACTHPSEK